MKEFLLLPEYLSNAFFWKLIIIVTLAISVQFVLCILLTKTLYGKWAYGKWNGPKRIIPRDTFGRDRAISFSHLTSISATLLLLHVYLFGVVNYNLGGCNPELINSFNYYLRILPELTTTVILAIMFLVVWYSLAVPLRNKQEEKN